VDMFERSRSRTWLLSSRTRRALDYLAWFGALTLTAHASVDIISASHGLKTGIHALGWWARGDAPRAWGREVARSGLASARGSAHRPSPSSTTFKTFAFARFFEASVQIRVNVRLAHGRPVCGA
jgi:hypothetical protein